MDKKKKKKKKINSDRIHNINNSNIPKCNPNYNIIIKEDNLKKIYSKRQKAELDMVRGLLIYDKKSFNFNIKNGNLINYFKFLNPTEPIIQINYRNIDKFYPLIRKNFISELCNNSNNNHFNNNNNDSQYQTFIDKNKIYNLIDNKKNINPNNNNTKIISNNIFPNEKANFQIHNQKEKINKKNYENFVYNENNEKIRFKTDENGLSMNFKKKIYDWLVDINIIKDKVIKIDSLPTLCINGVLLCDLINRCEGKNEILKGIIRRTSTRSQIQVNINKALEYLRSKEKFPSRHLWDNLEISRGNSLIIWQLLEDIYNFYGNKVTFERRIKKNSIKNQLNKTFTEENNKNFIKEDLEFNNFYSNTPLKERKMKTINAFRNKFANEINNSKHSSTSNMNKNTKNKIVENINTNKNKNILNYNKNKNENIHNINNFELRKESYNRNNLNHTNDNFYESEMFSIDNCNDNINLKDNRNKNNIFDNTYRKNLDISSIHSDRFLNVDKNNKSFSVNNGFYNKKRRNNINNGNLTKYNINSHNQSFLSSNVDNRVRNKGCFLLFEKNSINRLKEKIGALNKYNINDIETLDIKEY